MTGRLWPGLQLPVTREPDVVRVHVQSAEVMVKGMVLPCRQRAGDLWELSGRGPRWRNDPEFREDVVR